jgi:hypothetical protein
MHEKHILQPTHIGHGLRLTVTKPVSFYGYVFRPCIRYRYSIDDTGILTL